MSWQAYIDTSLVGSGYIDQAAIFDSEGTSPWAKSSKFEVTPEEMGIIVASFKEAATDSAVKPIQANGFKINGEKYFVLLSDADKLYGKQGKTGIVIVKTKRALLLAHYPETVQPGQATNTVEALGDYLRGLGY